MSISGAIYSCGSSLPASKTPWEPAGWERGLRHSHFGIGAETMLDDLFKVINQYFNNRSPLEETFSLKCSYCPSLWAAHHSRGLFSLYYTVATLFSPVTKKLSIIELQDFEHPKKQSSLLLMFQINLILAQTAAVSHGLKVTLLYILAQHQLHIFFCRVEAKIQLVMASQITFN